MAKKKTPTDVQLQESTTTTTRSTVEPRPTESQQKIETKATKGNRSSDLFKSFGIKNEGILTSFQNEERRVDTLGIFDYRNMRDNDGTVQMLLNAVYNTILAAGFTIAEGPEFMAMQTEPLAEPSEEKQFVEMTLLAKPLGGGMTREMGLVNREMLRAFEEGYRVFEVTYRRDGDRVLLDKLSPRAVRTHENELRLLVDDNGNFHGFRQVTSFKSQFFDVSVVNDTGTLKALNVVWGEEYGSNYGRSALKPVWYHYDKAHKGMFLNHVGGELGALKMVTVQSNGSQSKDDQEAIFDAVERRWQESTITYDNQKFTVEVMEASDPGVMNVNKEMIAMHQSQMAMALLAQFLQLGSEASDTGSRALGDSQLGFFKNSLESVVDTLLVRPWNRIISDVVRLNFSGENIPVIVWNPIRDDTAIALLDNFAEMIKGGLITDEIRLELLEKASEKFGLDVDKESLVQEAEEEKAEEEAKQQAEMEAKEQQAQAMRTVATNARLAELADASSTAVIQDTSGRMDVIEGTLPAPRRPLFKDELKVNLVDIKTKLDESRALAERALARKAEAQKDGIVDQYVLASRRGTKAISAVDIELQDNQEEAIQEGLEKAGSQASLSETLLLEMLAVMNFGKELAATEVGEEAPRTPKAIRERLVAAAERIKRKQEADLEFRLQRVAQQGLDANRPEQETKLLLEVEYDDFFSKEIQPTVNAALPEALNLGRAVSFTAFSDKVFAFRYTAIIDDRTTDFCLGLDGTVFQFTDPDFAMLTPPNHFGCRSIWTPITLDESDGIVVDGVDPEFPVFGASLNRFKDVTSVTELAELENDLDKMLTGLEHDHRGKD